LVSSFCYLLLWIANHSYSLVAQKFLIKIFSPNSNIVFPSSKISPQKVFYSVQQVDSSLLFSPFLSLPPKSSFSLYFYIIVCFLISILPCRFTSPPSSFSHPPSSFLLPRFLLFVCSLSRSISFLLLFPFLVSMVFSLSLFYSPVPILPISLLPLLCFSLSLSLSLYISLSLSPILAQSPSLIPHTKNKGSKTRKISPMFLAMHQ
jgi:hypothetical protein